MEPDEIIWAVNPLVQVLVEDLTDAHGDFAQAISADMLPSVLGIQPGFTHLRIVARLEQRFGRDMNANIRMQKISGNECLVICCGENMIALRPKKLDDHHLSKNHRSCQQDTYRATRHMSLFGGTADHVMLGYTEIGDRLQKELREVVLSVEGQSTSGAYVLDWSHTVWRQGEGPQGDYIAPTTLFPPPSVQPGYSIRPKRADGTGQAESTGAG